MQGTCRDDETKCKASDDKREEAGTKGDRTRRECKDQANDLVKSPDENIEQSDSVVDQSMAMSCGKRKAQAAQSMDGRSQLRLSPTSDRAILHDRRA